VCVIQPIRAVCCIVLQCVLQCVAACCSVCYPTDKGSGNGDEEFADEAEDCGDYVDGPHSQTVAQQQLFCLGSYLQLFAVCCSVLG